MDDPSTDFQMQIDTFWLAISPALSSVDCLVLSHKKSLLESKLIPALTVNSYLNRELKQAVILCLDFIFTQNLFEGNVTVDLLRIRYLLKYSNCTKFLSEVDRNIIMKPLCALLTNWAICFDNLIPLNKKEVYYALTDNHSITNEYRVVLFETLGIVYCKCNNNNTTIYAMGKYPSEEFFLKLVTYFHVIWPECQAEYITEVFSYEGNIDVRNSTSYLTRNIEND